MNKIKRNICIFMSVMVVSLTGCGSKDDDVEVLQPEVSVEVETPVEDEIIEEVITYLDYFPQVELLGLSLDEVSNTYEYTVDDHLDDVLKYVIEGMEICDVYYDNVFIYTDENDIVTSVEFDYFFGNLYGDLVDAKIQESASNLDEVYQLFTSLEAVDISSSDNSLTTIADDYNSGKLLEGGAYTSEFEIDDLSVKADSLVKVFSEGLIIMKSINFSHGEIINV